MAKNLFSTFQRFFRLRCAAALGTVFAASAIALACGGATDEGGSQQGVTPGDPCATEDGQAMASDGCNACACSNGEWVCTNVECPPPGTGGSGSTTDGGGTDPSPGSCTPGESRQTECSFCTCRDDGTWECPATGFCAGNQCTDGETMFDGCNTCSCAGGFWACTDRACPPAECPPAPSIEPSVSCPFVVVVARDPVTGMCCEYGNPCETPDGWEQFYTREECQGGSGGTCVDGEMMPAPDGCNTCTCTAGSWACTERGCGEPLGCGGRLGDTCTAAEYCAYEEGQYCGAADASAVCLPRPVRCTTEYAPVCACDGQTYPTACVAAAAGFGVNFSGPCTAAAD